MQNDGVARCGLVDMAVWPKKLKGRAHRAEDSAGTMTACDADWRVTSTACDRARGVPGSVSLPTCLTDLAMTFGPVPWRAVAAECDTRPSFTTLCTKPRITFLSGETRQKASPAVEAVICAAVRIEGDL